jgi:hypothetical protein
VASENANKFSHTHAKSERFLIKKANAHTLQLLLTFRRCRCCGRLQRLALKLLYVFVRVNTPVLCCTCELLAKKNTSGEIITFRVCMFVLWNLNPSCCDNYKAIALLGRVLVSPHQRALYGRVRFFVCLRAKTKLESCTPTHAARLAHLPFLVWFACKVTAQPVSGGYCRWWMERSCGFAVGSQENTREYERPNKLLVGISG